MEHAENSRKPYQQMGWECLESFRAHAETDCRTHDPFFQFCITRWLEQGKAEVGIWEDFLWLTQREERGSPWLWFEGNFLLLPHTS